MGWWALMNKEADLALIEMAAVLFNIAPLLQISQAAWL